MLDILQERQDIRSMSRVCAIERLFLPDMFLTIDKAIYIDNNIIFLRYLAIHFNFDLQQIFERPPEVLWSFFNDFSSEHIAAMAPGISKTNKIPKYGDTALDAGIFLMDLQMMRNIPDGWMRILLALEEDYKDITNLGDQDILNIFFSLYTDMLYELPCEWNYYSWLCRQVGLGILTTMCHVCVLVGGEQVCWGSGERGLNTAWA